MEENRLGEQPEQIALHDISPFPIATRSFASGATNVRRCFGLSFCSSYGYSPLFSSFTITTNQAISFLFLLFLRWSHGCSWRVPPAAATVYPSPATLNLHLSSVLIHLYPCAPFLISVSSQTLHLSTPLIIASLHLTDRSSWLHPQQCRSRESPRIGSPHPLRPTARCLARQVHHVLHRRRRYSSLTEATDPLLTGQANRL